jgi:hypothetical protein
MLGLAFLLLVRSEDAVGQVPLHLFINEDNFSGSWELSANAAASDDRIVLVPSSFPSRSGYAWRLRKSPHELWSAAITFEVSNTTALSQGSLFIIEEFGATGSHFGGFTKFHGAVVAFEVVNNTVSCEYRVNNGRISFENSTIMPHLTLDLVRPVFTIKVDFSTRNMVRVSALIENPPVVVYWGRTRIGNPKAWFSINGHCPSNDTELSVVRVRMSYEDEKPAPAISESPRAPPLIGVQEFDPASGLKHRHFNRLSRVLLMSRETAIIEGSADDVLEGMLEIGRVIRGSTKLHPTKQVIEAVMHNYTDSWRRRSLRMVSETEMLRTTLAGDVASVSYLVEDFRWNVGHETSQLRRQSKGAADSLTEGLREMVTEMTETSRWERSASHFLVKILIVLGIGEAIPVAIVALRHKLR